MIKQLNEITIACKQMTPIRSEQKMQEQLITKRYSQNKGMKFECECMQRNAKEICLLYILYTLLKKDHQIMRFGGI